MPVAKGEWRRAAENVNRPKRNGGKKHGESPWERKVEMSQEKPLMH